MRRTTSLENVVSILPPWPNSPRLSSSSDQLVIVTEEHVDDRRNSDRIPGSAEGRFSLSPLGVQSPSSVIAYDFSFLNETHTIQTVSFDSQVEQTASWTECSVSTANSNRIMSETLATSIPTDVVDSARDSRIPPGFTSTHSLNLIGDEVDDGTHSYASFDPMAGDDHDNSAVTHGSDPMIASISWRKHSLEDIKAINAHQRSFSAEDTLCNKENHYDRASIQNGLSFKKMDGNDSGNISGNVEFPLNGTTEEDRCEKLEPLERTLVAEEDRTLDMVDIESVQQEEIRRIEEAVNSLTEDLELPRASEQRISSTDEDYCVSPAVLLDDSMIPLVGTPHPMAYIPMEEVFTFIDRRTNQELPAISEEIEDQTLRRRRFTRSSSFEGRSRNSSDGKVLEADEPVHEPMRITSKPDVVPELDYPLLYDTEIPAGPIHRRAVSDNMGIPSDRRTELRRTQEMEEIDRAGNDVEVHMRSQRSRDVVRASSVVSNRCQSQVFLPQIGLSDTAASAPTLDRNMSSSDPSVNEENPSKPRECPPPVVLTRKASSIHNDSWKKQCAAEPPVQPTPVQMRKEPVLTASRPQSVNRNEKTGDRIEKKKTKTGSDTFSFGNLFGTNKGARSKKKTGIDRSLETVISSFQSKAGVGAAVSLPTRRMVSANDLFSSRPPIPDFEGLQSVQGCCFIKS
ncbi:hypothetical protein V3C99_006457 [Haemonchus contortus]